MPHAMIFDVDGTLVDSVDLHAKAWQDAFADFGYTLEFSVIRAQIGKGGDQLLPEFLSEDDIGRIGEQLETHRGKVFKDRYIDQVRPFPHVRTLIRHILDDGVAVALASSAKQAELDVYKKIAQIDDLIATETTSDDAEKSKPHPDIFVAALDRLGVDAAEVLVIGDTPYDAQAAAKADITPIGMLCGGWREQDLRGAGCVAVFDDPGALLKAWQLGTVQSLAGRLR